MGVLNCTPDSFSDGGLFGDRPPRWHRSGAHAAGAAVIDVGAESTRLGSAPVSARDQPRAARRHHPQDRRDRRARVDRHHAAQVAEHALAEGAVAVNTVSLTPAAELSAVAARHGAALVLMHSRGAMSAMKGFSVYADDAYGDVVGDVGREWSEAAGRAMAAGLPREAWCSTPASASPRTRDSRSSSAPAWASSAPSASPCSWGRAANRSSRAPPRPRGPLVPPDERLGGTIAALLACAARGAAILRVHDVAAAGRRSPSTPRSTAGRAGSRPRPRPARRHA